MSRSLLLQTLFVASASVLWAAPSRTAPAPTPSGSFALTHVRVEVGDGSVLENTTVVVKDGKVLQVGGAAPSGMAVVDASGKTLTPGLIETRTQLGTFEVQLEASTVDAELSAGALRPAFRVADGFNPASSRIPVARKGGITDAIVSPTGGVIAGQGAAFSLRGWPTHVTRAINEAPAARGDALRVPGAPEPERPAAMFINVGSGAVHGAGSARGGLWLKLRQAVGDTLLYAKSKAAYVRGDLRGLSMSYADLEAFVPVVRGELPMVVDVDRASDILLLLRFVDAMSAEGAKLNVVIAGGTEAWKVRGILAKRKIPVIVTPSAQGPQSFDALEARDDNPALLAKAGVPLIISTHDWDNNVRRLRQNAGIACAWGLPREAALPAITSTPARVFNLEGLGTIAKGKRANLVLWEGDPLEVSVLPVAVWIDGEAQSLASRQRDLAIKYGAGKVDKAKR